MAAIIWKRRFLNSDGSDFTDSGSNNIRLRNSDKDGNDNGAYGNMTYDSNGFWYISMTVESDSGYYLVQYTTNGSDYTTFQGFNPILIEIDETVRLSGSQTITGDKAFTGDNSVSGTLDITKNNLKISGVAVTTTAAELNYNAGVVSGTVTAGKTIVAGSSKDIDEIDVTTLKKSGVEITASADELNKCVGLTCKPLSLCKGEGINKTSVVWNGVNTKILTNSDGGFVEVDASSGSGTITLPALSDSSLPRFKIAISAGSNNTTIQDNSADSGFSLANADSGQVTGDTITLSNAGDCVILESSGYSGGRWLIVGGYNVDLS